MDITDHPAYKSIGRSISAFAGNTHLSLEQAKEGLECVIDDCRMRVEAINDDIEARDEYREGREDYEHVAGPPQDARGQRAHWDDTP